MLLLTFSVLDWKCPFSTNFIQKIKIVSLGWNLVTRLIRVCRIPWLCSLFAFQPKIPFLGKLGPKLKIFTLSWDLIPYLVIQICRIYSWCSLFLFSTGNTKIISLSWNLIPTISFLIFWDFSRFYQIVLPPQVNQWTIITYEHCIYQLTHELQNDLKT